MVRSKTATLYDAATKWGARGAGSIEEVAPAIIGRRNVSDVERVVCTLAGGALALFGLRAKSVSGLFAAAAGGVLVCRGATGWCPAYATFGIDTTRPHRDLEGASPGDYFRRAIQIEESVSVDRAPWDLYQFWRDLENLPRFMSHLEAVQVTDARRSHWVARGPAGTRVEWDAEIINDEPNALIAWRSLDRADVDNAGSVRFVPGPGGRGTEVKVVMDYIPPAGRVGSAVAELLGRDPAIQIREDLQRFKRFMESDGGPTAS